MRWLLLSSGSRASDIWDDSRVQTEREASGCDRAAGEMGEIVQEVRDPQENWVIGMIRRKLFYIIWYWITAALTISSEDDNPLLLLWTPFWILEKKWFCLILKWKGLYFPLFYVLVNVTYLSYSLLKIRWELVRSPLLVGANVELLWFFWVFLIEWWFKARIVTTKHFLSFDVFFSE